MSLISPLFRARIITQPLDIFWYLPSDRICGFLQVVDQTPSSPTRIWLPRITELYVWATLIQSCGVSLPMRCTVCAYLCKFLAVICIWSSPQFGYSWTNSGSSGTSWPVHSAEKWTIAMDDRRPMIRWIINDRRSSMLFPIICSIW